MEGTKEEAWEKEMEDKKEERKIKGNDQKSKIGGTKEETR
jgi:hypothetical protein